MIRIAEGYEQLWPGFGLRISSDLVFEEGGIYQLKGPNGSGKSSFISKILIPALSREDIWLLHFEQQASLQLQAVKAWAAIFRPGVPVRTETEMVSFLLDDLYSAYQKVPKPIWIVADEIHHINQVLERELPCGLIYCAHHIELPMARVLAFEPIDAGRSVLRA